MKNQSQKLFETPCQLPQFVCFRPFASVFSIPDTGKSQTSGMITFYFRLQTLQFLLGASSFVQPGSEMLPEYLLCL